MPAPLQPVSLVAPSAAPDRAQVAKALLTTGTTPTAAQGQPATLAPNRAQAVEALRSSPVIFIENVGQFDERARFQVWGGPGTMWLAEDAIWVTVVGRGEASPLEVWSGTKPRADGTLGPRGASDEMPRPYEGVNLKLSFVGANPHPRLEPFDRLDTVVSYFIGNDPAKWRPDVPVWGGVRYVDLYPGIDLIVGSGLAPAHGGLQGLPLPWRLDVRDGADSSAVTLRVEGADDLSLEGDSLRLTTALGECTVPLLWIAGVPDSDLANPTLTGYQVALPFASATHNPQSTIAYPQSSDLVYATYLGGSESDSGWAIAVDGSGSAYVTGGTASSDFPTAPGAFDTTHNSGYEDVFVAKLNPAGSGLLYATFLGGSGWDEGDAIAVDAGGNAYVTGATYSYDFPATPGAFDTTWNGGGAFVVKVNSAGSGLLYATFLGGSVSHNRNAIAVDGSGSAYVTGVTNSSDFPTTPGAFDRTFNGIDDAFVARLNPAGSSLLYATFLGGSGSDDGLGIAVDGGGNAYVTGQTCSSDFPTTPGAFDASLNGGCDAFVAKLTPAESGLLYASFLGGGSEWDAGDAIAVDGGGNAYVTGVTWSSDFPTTPGSFDTTHNGGYYDVFVAKLNPAGSGLLYATFLGGSSGDSGSGIAVDRDGNAYVTGPTSSSDFPTTPGSFDTTYNGGYHDAFVAKLNPAGSGLLYATFLGGSNNDFGWAIAADGGGNAYVTGDTGSSEFPTVPGAFDGSYNGGGDIFVAKLAVKGGPQPTYSISGRVTDGSGNPIPDVTISDGAGHTVTTDGNGNYTLSGLAAGTYTITPSKSGYTFSPASRTVSVPPDAAGQDFTGSSISTLPIVTTLPASEPTLTSATLNGTVNPNGSETSAWFEWGTERYLTVYTSTQSLALGSGTGPVVVTATLPISIGVSYYYRVAAQNPTGTVRGEIKRLLVLLGNDPTDGKDPYWNRYDRLIHFYAHAQDLPATIVKAIIAHESGGLGTNNCNPSTGRCNPNSQERPDRAFLYEPIGVDEQYVQKKSSAYSQYRLPLYPPPSGNYPYNPYWGLPVQIISGTTNLDMICYVCSYKKTDACATWRELCNKENWWSERYDSSKKTYYQQLWGLTHPGGTPTEQFVAQYRLASSYGLGQLLYWFHHDRINDQAPEVFYDPEANIRAMIGYLDNRRQVCAPRLGRDDLDLQAWKPTVQAYNSNTCGYSYPGFWPGVQLHFPLTQPALAPEDFDASQILSPTLPLGLMAIEAASAFPSPGEYEVDRLVADVKGIGQSQLVALYAVVSDPAIGVEAGKLKVFSDEAGSAVEWESPPMEGVLAAGVVFTETVPEGGAPTICAVWGAGAHGTRLYPFRWDGQTFQSLEAVGREGERTFGFFGDAGVGIVEGQVRVGGRDGAQPLSVFHVATYQWEASTQTFDWVGEEMISNATYGLYLPLILRNR